MTWPMQPSLARHPCASSRPVEPLDWLGHPSSRQRQASAPAGGADYRVARENSCQPLHCSVSGFPRPSEPWEIPAFCQMTARQSKDSDHRGCAGVRRCSSPVRCESTALPGLAARASRRRSETSGHLTRTPRHDGEVAHYVLWRRSKAYLRARGLIRRNVCSIWSASRKRLRGLI